MMLYYKGHLLHKFQATRGIRDAITFTYSTKRGLALILNEQFGPSCNVEDPYSPNISVTDTVTECREEHISKDSE